MIYEKSECSTEKSWQHSVFRFEKGQESRKTSRLWLGVSMVSRKMAFKYVLVLIPMSRS